MTGCLCWRLGLQLEQGQAVNDDLYLHVDLILCPCLFLTFICAVESNQPIFSFPLVSCKELHPIRRCPSACHASVVISSHQRWRDRLSHYSNHHLRPSATFVSPFDFYSQWLLLSVHLNPCSLFRRSTQSQMVQTTNLTLDAIW